MASTHFEEKDRNAHESERDHVGDEEGPAPIPVAEVGEPPDVAETKGEAEAGEKELDWIVPVSTDRILISIGFFRLFFGADEVLISTQAPRNTQSKTLILGKT